ncbi:MAG: UDP-N-acetylmuramoyl-L-alanyl-D-glutamate--2,6-diaminopimelate ligase [Deltaproteobacteria bacterium]|nr:MAG: UDP-N-acetylmuramoyl-L-alanyl-D-glutamate--2,6-diaminopimelate ligase [Deltaproteobacteria bacterium]
MKLTEYLHDLSGARVAGDPDVDVRAVRDDSRRVEPGDLFVAVRGATVDGHAFAAQAASRGAAAVVVDHELPDVACTQVIVPDTELALGLCAARMYGRPHDALALVAVTGTNGKTTTTYLVEAILAAAGARPGVIGTVNYRYAGQVVPAPYTTPTPLELHRVLAAMRDAGCTHVVAETSSAALAMGRLAGVAFDVAVFTNLTQDHLDVHGSMDAYAAAKRRLFADHLAPGGAAVAFVDDPHGRPMLDAAPAGARRIAVTLGSDAGADVRVAASESTIAGLRAAIDTPRGRIDVASAALIGAYNVANTALAVAVGEALGLPHAAVARGIADLDGVPGRVERVDNDAGLDIVVDYAHTPDALANVLAALRPLTRRRLLCVFGCGGDRDPTKRAPMGAAVAAGADCAYVTSDNPRTEDPDAIIRMILAGVPDPTFVHRDRRLAIRAAVADAVPGDVVLIAGKGHEDYQDVGGRKIHFDDRQEARAAVAARRPIVVDGHAFSRVVIDSRIAAPGDLYVAIRGERFDGHAFCAAAVDAGATGVVVEPGRGVPGAIVIERPDTRAALGAIARDVRRRWGRPVIGVTGSVGKTTTKELIAAALGAVGCPLATRGSLNNETGVPLTLLRLADHYSHAVIEMGMRGLGQIAYLRDIAEPDVGVVVNAGVAHVGVVGSRDAIARGKAELFERLPPHGVAVYPAADERLAARAAAAPRAIGFGDADGADVRLTTYTPAGAAGADVEVVAFGERLAFRLPLVGRHNAIDATCAIAAATAVGVAPADAVRGLANARPAWGRSEVRDVAGRHVLVDCYNANPDSTAAALRALAELRGERAAVAVLGDMLELGDEAAAAHRAAGRLAAELGIDVVAVGAFQAELGGTAADDADDAARIVAARTRPGDWVLVKASRAVGLERVVDALARRFGQ